MRPFLFVDLLKQVVSCICTHRKSALDYELCTHWYFSVCGSGARAAPRGGAESSPSGLRRTSAVLPAGLMPSLLLPASPYPVPRPRELLRTLQALSHHMSSHMLFLLIKLPCLYISVRIQLTVTPWGPISSCFSKDFASSEISSLLLHH